MVDVFFNTLGQLRKKINEFFSRDITPSQFHNTDYENEISVPSSPSKEQENYIEDPEYFDKLIDSVDLTYIGGEDDLASLRPKSEIPAV
jgi:hypothetical protein